MKKIPLAFCAASAVFAASNYNYEITPFAGLSHYAHENLKDSAFYGMKVARNLDFPWLSQIELGIDQALSVNTKIAQIKATTKIPTIKQISAVIMLT